MRVYKIKCAQDYSVYMDFSLSTRGRCQMYEVRAQTYVTASDPVTTPTSTRTM